MTALEIADDVAKALFDRAPVVALESTVITHGMAFPDNAETALAMQEAIRERGAIPATIAIIDGVVRVGLSSTEIEQLARSDRDQVQKCSARDLAVMIGRNQTASTTVAATMVIAHRAGIELFATGGIGGVHRGHPFDVSADVTMLGRIPVCVICAGAKSILDLPLTLEMLETQGVPIVGIGTSTLPAFYTQSSGLALAARADDLLEATRILRAWRNWNKEGGLVFALPVPDHAALTREDAETAIATATGEAKQQGITGAAVTPFVLSRVVALTKGRALTANKALLLNNARFAADLAVAASD